MGTNVCPACGAVITVSDINVDEGVALCRACGQLSRLSDVAVEWSNFNTFAPPPRGCSYEELPGHELLARVSLKSLPAAAILLLFGTIWNGLLSVFVLGVISGLYRQLIGPPPLWFFSSSDHGGIAHESIGGLLMVCLFLSPFLLAGVCLFVLFLMSLLGRIELRISGSDGTVRTGFGPFNRTHRFNAGQLTRVSRDAPTNADSAYSPRLRIDADRTFTFGGGMSEDQRIWMLGILRWFVVRKSQKMQA